MITDGIPFSIGNTAFPDVKREAISSFIRFIEKKLGVVVLYDKREIPFGRLDLVKPSTFIQKLLENGVISQVYPSSRFPDEPPYKSWVADILTTGSNKSDDISSSGASWTDDGDALMAMLAEALERHIWRETDDYFRNKMRASVREMRDRALPFVSPDQFSGYSAEQRKERKELQFTEETPFLWIEGFSLVSAGRIYLPAQTVAGFHHRGMKHKEPSIRSIVSNGLASWPTQEGARLAGALEVIERDAYLIMWMNQLTLPRLALTPLCAKYPSLAKIVETLGRYRFKMHVIQMLTDAPAHAICVVIEDLSGQAPRFTFGLRTDRSLQRAIEKASLEAMRMHHNTRIMLKRGPWDESTPKKEIGHLDRVHYWATGDNAKKLEFLVQGEERDVEPPAWDNDTEAEHLARVIEWCRESGFECISVPLTHSKKNPTSLHIEMLVMPELQPTYVSEKNMVLGGTRWKTVPRKFGLTPREQVFTDEPHPFA